MVVSVEVLPKHRDVWIKYGEGFFVIFLRRLVSCVHRAAEGSLGLGAEGKVGYAVWGWYRGVREPRDQHKYLMQHMKYCGHQTLPLPAGNVAAPICS